jgi:endonuclease/exonuclease/phosphatase family metal-dependent hydrolase
VSELKSAGDAVVVAGDLNAPPDRPEIELLLAELDDCWQPEMGDGVTYSSVIPIWATANGSRTTGSTTSSPPALRWGAIHEW